VPSGEPELLPRFTPGAFEAAQFFLVMADFGGDGFEAAAQLVDLDGQAGQGAGVLAPPRWITSGPWREGRRVSAAGPLRGPGKGGGFAAAGPLAPAKGTGPLLWPPGALRAAALRAALDPGTAAAPGNRKAAGHRPAPPGSGRKKASPCRADHHNRSLHAFRGTRETCRARSEPVVPGYPGTTARPAAPAKPTSHPKPGASTISNRISRTLND